MEIEMPEGKTFYIIESDAENSSVNLYTQVEEDEYTLVESLMESYAGIFQSITRDIAEELASSQDAIVSDDDDDFLAVYSDYDEAMESATALAEKLGFELSTEEESDSEESIEADTIIDSEDEVGDDSDPETEDYPDEGQLEEESSDSDEIDDSESNLEPEEDSSESDVNEEYTEPAAESEDSSEEEYTEPIAEDSVESDDEEVEETEFVDLATASQILHRREDYIKKKCREELSQTGDAVKEGKDWKIKREALEVLDEQMQAYNMPLEEAVKQSGIDEEQLKNLFKVGKVKAKHKGDKWMVSKKSLKFYCETNNLTLAKA